MRCIVGKYRTPRVCIGDHANGEFSKSKTDERGGYTLTWTPNGKKSPLYAYSPADIEKATQKLAELEKDEKRLIKQRARTKLGKLEAIRDQAYDLALDRMWDLIWTVPTTLNGLAALLRYCRVNNGINQLVYNDEWEKAIEWTMERAVCTFAGLPEPPMGDVVASIRPDVAAI